VKIRRGGEGRGELTKVISTQTQREKRIFEHVNRWKCYFNAVEFSPKK